MTRINASYKAFREPDLISDPLDIDGDFSTWEARRLRYAIYWRFCENQAYVATNRWAKAYKTNYGLYKYVRNIYNPAYRLVEFWKAHLWGGMLDRSAAEAGALVIVTDNEALREAISQVWRWSNWQIKKDLVTLNGAALGDSVISVVDDTARGRVYLHAVHPGKLKSVTFDNFGNVKAYCFEEERTHPDNGNQTVTYTEEAINQGGGSVLYRTLLNGSPWDWTGNGGEWEAGYGFVPLVVIRHNDVGLDWGWSELHPGRSKIHEVDDLASKLSDQIRKTVDAPWLFTGVAKPSTTLTTTETTLTGTAAQNRPQPGREELPALYGPEGADAKALIADLNIADTIAHIKEILSEIERDYPELKLIADLQRAGGDISGRALRIAQGPAADKVRQRRVNYDDALVRAQQMAVAIGGERGYFDGFNLGSYAAGNLEHSLKADRPVFSPDPMDTLEIQEKKFTIGELPKVTRWRELGYSDEEGIPQLIRDAGQEDQFGLIGPGEQVTGVQQ